MKPDEIGGPAERAIAAGGDVRAIRIAGDVAVIAPASLRVLTSYVLLEQEDWFESELAFVRRLLAPGMRAIDIGANYGVYALTAARRVGATGRVVAFEPAADVALMLGRSAAHNAMPWLEVVAAAVGAASGRARLAGSGAELRTIMAPPSGGAGEDVALVALDDWHRAADFGPADFVKIDVEGAEAAVIAGGRAFFAAQSPLVMLEVWDGTGRYDFAAVRALRDLGYRAYRLLPGPAILVPLPDPVVDGREAPERFLINVLCCKPDCAARLAARDLLVPSEEQGAAVRGDGIALCLAQPAFAPLAALGERLRAGSGVPGADAYRQALDHYAAAAEGAPAARRAAALAAACRALDAALRQAAPAPRLLSAIRIYAESGRRASAIEAVERMLALLRAGEVTLPEPFVVAMPRYAALIPTLDGLESWIGAQVCEAYEFLVTFSTWFFSRGTVDRVGLIEQAGYLTAALERRRQLVRIAAGAQARPMAHPVFVGDRDTLNAGLWTGA